MDGPGPASRDAPPLVSIVLPLKNEAAHLGHALDAIERQSYPADRIEIVAVDGGSSDATLDLLRARQRRDRRISILGGPDTNTPRAMNVGIDASRGEYIAKVDGHGWISDTFVETSVRHLTADTRLGCVGGRIVPIAATTSERAIAYARFSRLGVGVGVYTLLDRPQLTDTVQCGVYRRSAVAGVGNFDPNLPYGEDEELNHRLRRAGWTILMDPSMRFSYRVRPSLRALFLQYLRYGRARVAVVRKHPDFLRPKHAFPAALVSTLGGSALMAPFAGRAALAPWVAYAAVLLVGTAALSAKHRFARPDLVGWAIAALHVGYGLGTLRGLLDHVTLRRSVAPDDC